MRTARLLTRKGSSLHSTPLTEFPFMATLHCTPFTEPLFMAAPISWHPLHGTPFHETPFMVPPCEQNESQTDVKTLPFPKLRLRMVKRYRGGYENNSTSIFHLFMFLYFTNLFHAEFVTLVVINWNRLHVSQGKLPTYSRSLSLCLTARD